MQGRRGQGDPFSNISDPFAGFGGFGSSGGPRSMLSSFFGGSSPFDDPFFSNPFGGMPQLGNPFGGMPQLGIFGSGGSPFPNFPGFGHMENQVQPNRSRGPIIEEINSDDEKEGSDEKNEKSRKHGRSGNESFVEDPDEAEGRRGRHMQLRNQIHALDNVQSRPQTHSFTYHCSSVTYGGPNGAYYTSSKARRIGSDGLVFEETKEADSTTREASHHISRGIHDKGHSLSRKLKSDGKVETMQTLHNLQEGEMASFESDWQGKANKHMPHLAQSFNNLGYLGSGNGQTGEANRIGWAPPSTERREQSSRAATYGTRGPHTMKMNPDAGKKDADHSCEEHMKWKKIPSKK